MHNYNNCSDQHSTNTRPILDQHSTNTQPTLDQYSTLTRVRTVRRLTGGRKPSVTEDFALGAFSGAAAAAATTPLDVIKTTMMCTAAARPTMMSAARLVYADGGAAAFLRGIGPRAASNGVNSAVFFCFFEAIRSRIAERRARLEGEAALLNGSKLVTALA